VVYLPRGIFPRAARERQQGDVPRAFDLLRQLALVLCAGACLAPRAYLSFFGCIPP